jgi:carbonic anhydrase
LPRSRHHVDDPRAQPRSPYAHTVSRPPRSFADLLTANVGYQTHFSHGGFDGVAHAGVAMLTCMDSRIEPLDMIGLRFGDAKIIRTPGGRLTPDALVGCVLGVHLLGVRRILVVPHTRCAMASGDDSDIVATVRRTTGADLSDLAIGASPDQRARLMEDVNALRSHEHIAGRALVGGFLYDVDTGALHQVM